MTGLQYLFQGGGSTFDYSAVNWNSMPSLSYVYVKGMTQPQVDALLAGMWANKDASKPYNNTTRIITCTSGCAAPSAAGYITKANLQAYATPGNNYPTYSYWTVNTN